MENFKNIKYKGNDIRVNEDGTIIYINDKLVNAVKNKEGYMNISIFDFDKNIWTSVRSHQLVAIAFVKKRNNYEKLEVNHIDYIRDNNHYTNLEWITHAENVRYSNCNRRDISGSNNPNYNNKTLSEKYKNNPSLSKEKQSRPKLQNGRCRKIDMFDCGEFMISFDYIEDCMTYISENINSNISPQSVRGRIDESIRYNRPYLKRYTFKKY